MLDDNSIDEATQQYLDLPIVEEGSTGVEVEDKGEDISEPFDPNQIRITTNPMTMDLLINRIKNDELNLSPEFQREGGIWDDKIQSRLIESIIIRIPIQAFYMDGTDEDNWLTVDGQQRLYALKRFVIDSELRLTGLEFLKELENKTYSELPRNLQRRILESQVIVYIINKGSPDNLKFNIFKRINTGGLPLSEQEMRHALYQGKSTQLLKKLATSEGFKATTNFKIKDNRMTDRELVLKFLAFTLHPYKEFKKNDKYSDLDSFLIETMKEINLMPDEQIERLEDKFNKVMAYVKEIFGDQAFRRQPEYNFPINKALFEVWTVNLSRLSLDQINLLIANKHILLEKFYDLLKSDNNFHKSITSATYSQTSVTYRFSKIESLIHEAAH